MRVVDVAVRQCYRFNCPNCGSKLEADCDELVDIGGKTSQFWCPICRKERYVPWSALRKRTIYEDKSAEVEKLQEELSAFKASSDRYQLWYYEYRSAVAEVFGLGMIDKEAYDEIERRAKCYQIERENRT